MTVSTIQQAYDDRDHFEWPEPDLAYLQAGDSNTPVMPSALFGSLFPVVQALADDCSASVDYVAHALIASAASLLSGRLRVRPLSKSRWLLSPVVWIGLVGDPSSRKTPALEAAVRALYRLQGDLDRATAEERKKHADAKLYSESAAEKYKQDVRTAAREGNAPPVRPPEAEEPPTPRERRLHTTDTTVEKLCDILSDNPEGILLKRGELAGWYHGIDRYHNGSKQFWIEGYDANPYTVDRRNREETLKIEAVCISLLGTIQPDLVSEILRDPEDGFAARMVFIWPERRPFKAPDTLVDDDRLYEIYVWLDTVEFDSGPKGEKIPREIPLSPAASVRFEEWYANLDKRSRGVTGHYGYFLGKAAGTVARVALVSEYLKAAASQSAWKPPEVSLDTIEAAIEWMEDYALPMALKVYGCDSQEPAERDARLLLAFLQRHATLFFNKRELMREHKSELSTMRKGREFDAAISRLEEAGWVHKMESNGSGRPRGDYHVHPRLHRHAD